MNDDQTTSGGGEMSEVSFYQGRGNHSVYQLEDMMVEREEALYQKQLKIQSLQAELKEARERVGSADANTPFLLKYIEDLEFKLLWMTRKRWALEDAIADMELSNISRISSNSDEALRESHRGLRDPFDRAIKWAGGISIYTTWGVDDFTYTPPCYIGAGGIGKLERKKPGFSRLVTFTLDCTNNSPIDKDELKGSKWKIIAVEVKDA